jgi:hypothetical protein
MTNDQWQDFEQSMHLAPEECKIMYTHDREMTHVELVRLTTSLLSCSELLNHMCQKKQVNQDEFNDTAGLVNAMLSAMYGRLMGLAKKCDTLITKQVVLEAELASTGK